MGVVRMPDIFVNVFAEISRGKAMVLKRKQGAVGGGRRRRVERSVVSRRAQTTCPPPRSGPSTKTKWNGTSALSASAAPKELQFELGKTVIALRL